MAQSTPHQPTPELPIQHLPFIMIDADRAEAPLDIDGPNGEYDPLTQTWTGRIRIGAGTYSSRSNGARGGYSHQSDD